MPFRQQIDFGGNQYLVLDGDPSEIQKDAVKVDEYVLPVICDTARR